MRVCPLQVSRFVRLDIDPKNIMWRRVVDINDRWVGSVPQPRASWDFVVQRHVVVCVVPTSHACAKRCCLLPGEGLCAHSHRAQCTLLRHLLSTAQQGVGHAYAHVLLLHGTVLAGEICCPLEGCRVLSGVSAQISTSTLGL